jgi:Arylsulfotransferase (ASST)
VVTVGDFEGDLHDFQITSNGTALVIIYDLQVVNLLEQGGPESGFIYDGVFQEIDIATGNLLFEWHTSHHLPLNTSYSTLQGRGKDRSLPWDPYHINSIDKDAAGNYLLSMRHTQALYSVDGTTGQILWTLGGKMNEFTDVSDGQATDFSWQHDARWRDDHTITLFDNNANGFLGPTTQSRGMLLDLDVQNRVVALRAAYFHPDGIRAHSQGNMQILPESGNVFVGWGHCGAYTEFSPDGEVLCDTHYAPSNWFQLSNMFSYRVYKSSWVGNPLTNPRAAVLGDLVYVSWNGATEVVAWRLELWDGSDLNEMNFMPSLIVEKHDFETQIVLPKDPPNAYFRVVALDNQHKVLGRTEVLAKHHENTFMEMLGMAWNLMSSAVAITIFMLICCVILGIFWTWKLWPSRLSCRWGRRFRFQPVSTDEDTDIPLMDNTHDD